MPYVAGLPAKQIELATEIVPKARKIGILGNMNDPKAKAQREEMTEATTKLGLEVVAPELKGPDDLGRAIDALASERTDAIVVFETTMLLSARDQVARLISEKGIPAVYGYREHVQAGGLISYGVDLVWCWRRVATFAQKILGGAAPADLPVEFPTKIQLAVNLIAAKAIGVSLPPTLITRADEVIRIALATSVSWHLADIRTRPPDVCFQGVKRTCRRRPAMSANDPKRTSLRYGRTSQPQPALFGFVKGSHMHRRNFMTLIWGMVSGGTLLGLRAIRVGANGRICKQRFAESYRWFFR